MVSLRFLVSRAANRFLTLLVLMLLSFFIFEVIPQAVGLPVANFFAGVSPFASVRSQSVQLLVDRAIRTWYLNAPLPLRVLYFLRNLFLLRFGISSTFQKPVTTVIAQFMPRTLLLASVSLLTTSIISIVLGVVAAKSFLRSKTKVADKVSSTFSIATYFIPIIWLGIFVYVFFADQLHLFPINLAFALGGGTHTFSGLAYYGRYLWAATLPIVVLTVTGFGHRQQLLRNNLIEEYNSSSYSIYARARGIDEGKIFYKHSMRNAILPWATQVGLDVAFLIYGLFFVEVIFQFPGIGYASVTAATMFDIPFLIATTFLFGVYTLVVLYILDLVYGILDPRISLGD